MNKLQIAKLIKLLEPNCDRDYEQLMRWRNRLGRPLTESDVNDCNKIYGTKL